MRGKIPDTKARDQWLAEVDRLIEFIDNQAIAESYHPFARKFLSVSRILREVKSMVKVGQVEVEE